MTRWIERSSASGGSSALAAAAVQVRGPERQISVPILRLHCVPHTQRIVFSFCQGEGIVVELGTGTMPQEFFFC